MHNIPFVTFKPMSFLQRLQKFQQRASGCPEIASSLYDLGCGEREYLLAYCAKESEDPAIREANGVADSIVELSQKRLDIMKKNRLTAAICLVSLFFYDIRFRRSGMTPFLLELYFLMRYSKSKIKKMIGDLPKT